MLLHVWLCGARAEEEVLQSSVSVGAAEGHALLQGLKAEPSSPALTGSWQC